MRFWTRLLHRFVSVPGVYDFAQCLAGGRFVYRRLSAHASRLPGGGWALDVGGGTGALHYLFRRHRDYLCLDLDVTKLIAFRRRGAPGLIIHASATRIPLLTGSIDVALCSAVTHHLDDAALAQMLSEVQRVLATDGRLLLMDAIWAPERWSGRFLWRHDRGSHPRTATSLRSAVGAVFLVRHEETVTALHRYLILVCSPRPRA